MMTWFHSHTRRVAAGLLALCLCVCEAPVAAAGSETPAPSGDAAAASVPESGSYADYLAAYGNASRTSQSISLAGSGYATVEHTDAAGAAYDGAAGVQVSEENRFARWEFEVPASGLYQINLSYYPVAGNGQDIILSLALDGTTPFAEADSLVLPRLWRDETAAAGEGFAKDVMGNDIRPKQVECPRWTDRWLQEDTGLYDEPLLFYLTAGRHTLQLSFKREPVAVRELTLGARAAAPTYSSYIGAVSGGKVGEALYAIEAESAIEKNTAMLAPSYDTTNAAMSPANEPGKVLMTMIGDNNWYQNGQSLTWRVPDDVKPGLYQIQLRVRQRVNAGMPSYRALYINGELPFAEAAALEFPYSSDWRIHTLGDAEGAYYFSLKPGDTLTLEATTGPMSEVLRAVNSAVRELNRIYRQIITVTGVDPDVYRDYSIEKEIPTLLGDLEKMRVSVDELSVLIKTHMGKATSQTATLDQLSLLIASICDQPNTIAEDLSTFKGCIDSVASIILAINEQPLALDVIYLKGENTPTPAANAGFFRQLWFGVRRLVYSFAGDYDRLSQTAGYGSAITVWAMTGRDQAQALSRQISDDFSPQYGVGVELDLISSESMLLQAMLAGLGPDATVLTGRPETPINLALRNAVVNLADPKYGLTQEIKDRFYPSAWEPFTYRGGIYAIPELQDYQVMFYRTDILEQLGVKVPETWDEFYDVVKVLHTAHYVMGIQEVASDLSDGSQPGISPSIAIFDAFLFQNGGEYYDAAQTRTAFDTPQAYAAFDAWVKLYKNYGFERSFEFTNMFRSGEMPMGIAPLVKTYSKISATAPELRGLWSFAPIPGIRLENGEIDRSESSDSMGCMLHTAAVKRGVDMDAFQFMLWWTDAEAQVNFCNTMEASMGIAGRRAVANREAAERLGWSVEERAVINEQVRWVRGISQVPGSYIVKRSLTNALRKSVDMGEENRRTLTVYNRFINDELLRKSREFE